MAAASKAVRVKVLFFGRLKEVLGSANAECELPSGSTLETLFANLAARHPQLARYRSSIVPSRNQEFAAWDTALQPGDEIAFLPPVSGS